MKLRLPRRGKGTAYCGCARNSIPRTIQVTAIYLMPGMAFVRRVPRHNHSEITHVIMDVKHRRNRSVLIDTFTSKAQAMSAEREVWVTW